MHADIRVGRERHSYRGRVCGRSGQRAGRNRGELGRLYGDGALVPDQREDRHTYYRHSYDHGDHPGFPFPYLRPEGRYAGRDGLLAGGCAGRCGWSTPGSPDLLAHEAARHRAAFTLPDRS